MHDTCTEFVIQISTAASITNIKGDETETVVNPAAADLLPCLQPGTEIGLIFHRYVAIASIQWISGPTLDKSMRAGVRLIRLSARREKRRESAP